MNERIHRIKYVKILELLRQESDGDRPLTTTYIINKLKERGVTVDRRTLYKDMKTLNDNGYEILCYRSRQNEYFIVDRQFDVPELRILMDAVQAASFIPENKTIELQEKIADLGGSYRKDLLIRDNVCFNTNKHSNKQTFYSVNEIEESINRNKKISFKYFDLDYQGNKVYRKEGTLYEVNPIATVFSNDNYYLVCFMDKYENYSNYRIDRMETVRILEADRADSKLIKEFNINKYRKQSFGMFAGEPQAVTLEFDESLVDVIFDKFGEQTPITKLNDQYQTRVNVIVCEQFYGVMLGLGGKIKITAPESVAQGLKEYVNQIVKIYG